MLKNGEISIDEANALLEELEKVQTEKTRKEDYLLYEATPVFQEESTESKRDAKSFLKVATDKISSLFDTAAKKLKELDLDFYHSVTFEHVFQTNETDFTDIVIDLAFGSTTIHVWDVDEVRAECRVKVYRTEEVEEGKKKFLASVTFGKEGHTFSFESRDKFTKVDAHLYVPRNKYEDLYVKLLNGSIEAEGLQAEKWHCRTINGKIRLADCQGDEGELETGNGIVIGSNNTFRKLEVDTVNGKINVDGSYQKMELKTITGTIHTTIKNKDADTIQIDSGTAAIYVTIPEEVPVYGELKANLGAFNVELDDVHIINSLQEPVQKKMKFERGIDGSEQPLFLYVESKTGAIFIKG